MKKLILYSSLILISVQCGNNQSAATYHLTIPEEIIAMKGRLDTLEKMNLPGMELEIKAIRLNIAVAELNNLDTYVMQKMSEQIDKTGKRMTEAEVLNLKNQIKHDSIKASLEKIIEENRIN